MSAGTEPTETIAKKPVWTRPWVIGVTALVLGVGIGNAGGDGTEEAADSSVAAYSAAAPTTATAPSTTRALQAAPAAPATSSAPVVVAPVPAPLPAPAPAPAPRPAPAPAPAPVPLAAPVPAAGVVYANCDDVKAHGAAPIRPGDPGWEQKFDRDNDGVGCES
jgi:hypothetical protein